MLPAWMIADIGRKKSEEDREVLYEGGHVAHEVRDPDSRDDDRDTDGDNDRVLEAGSGGGQPAPAPQPDYEAQSRAQLKLEEARAAQAEKDRIAKEERDAAKLEADKRAFQGKLSGAYSTAQNYGSSRLRNLGIEDTYGILPAYYAELDAARSKVPELDPNPGSYFSNSLFEEALGGARTQQRNKLTKRYESEVPTGYESTFIPDTADDVLIGNIIGEQFREASDYLGRARDRGQLNDIGYNTALRNLGSARSGATARANELGAGVLESGRQSLRDIDKQARAGITDWDFGDTFDPDLYEGRIKSKAGEFTGGLEGKLRNTFGETQFFDPDSLIAKGTKAQGTTNPGAGALQDAITEEERRRTSGSVGAF